MNRISLRARLCLLPAETRQEQQVEAGAGPAFESAGLRSEERRQSATHSALPLSTLGLGPLGGPSGGSAARTEAMDGGLAPSSLLSCEHLGEAAGLVRALDTPAVQPATPGPRGTEIQRAHMTGSRWQMLVPDLRPQPRAPTHNSDLSTLPRVSSPEGRSSNFDDSHFTGLHQQVNRGLHVQRESA